MKLLKIGAVWCPGCLVMKPRLQEIEKEIPELVTEFYDFDKDKEVMQKYSVNHKLPVFIFLDKNENEISRLTGEIDKKDLIKVINDNITK